MVYLSVSVAIVAVTYFCWKVTARSAYESAEYTVLEADGPFETHQYPDLMMATTNMQFESQGDDGSFMQLFQYISGANDAEQKVAMTALVFMDSEATNDQVSVVQRAISIPGKGSELIVITTPTTFNASDYRLSLCANSSTLFSASTVAYPYRFWSMIASCETSWEEYVQCQICIRYLDLCGFRRMLRDRGCIGPRQARQYRF
jgi:hypothetical protein